MNNLQAWSAGRKATTRNNKVDKEYENGTRERTSSGSSRGFSGGATFNREDYATDEAYETDKGQHESRMGCL